MSEYLEFKGVHQISLVLGIEASGDLETETFEGVSIQVVTLELESLINPAIRKRQLHRSWALPSSLVLVSPPS